jgi:anionic cell wall polymer biosynthesis LytR-Cps2A-Psr (LCP) family protein
MKKKLALFMAVVFSCLFLLAGCAGAGASPFEGTWKLTKGESAGVTLEAELLESAIGEITITLEKDGKATMESTLGESGEGTWEAKDNTTVVVTVDGEDQEMTLENGELTMEASGAKLTFEKQ